jgi:aconitate hydratase
MPSVHLNPPGTGIMHTINLEQLATVGTVVDGWLCPSESHTPRVALRG